MMGTFSKERTYKQSVTSLINVSRQAFCLSWLLRESLQKRSKTSKPPGTTLRIWKANEFHNQTYSSIFISQIQCEMCFDKNCNLLSILDLDYFYTRNKARVFVFVAKKKPPRWRNVVWNRKFLWWHISTVTCQIFMVTCHLFMPTCY